MCLLFPAVLGRHDGGHTFVHVQLLMEAESRYFWHQTLSSQRNRAANPTAVKNPGLSPELAPNRRNSGKAAKLQKLSELLR